MPRMDRSDPPYKLMFSQPRMVEDTMRGFLAPQWGDELDFSTLTRMNAEYIGADLHHRIGDMVWRVEFQPHSPLGGPPPAHGKRPCLLVLFEFQSTVDLDMAWRMHEYVYLLHRHLRHTGTVKAQGREPPVMPVVVYNGDRPWTAAHTRAGPVVGPPGASGWTGNRVQAYVTLDERARADDGAGMPPDNRMTTLIGLETSPVEMRPRLLMEAFERYPGGEEKGLREGYHARVKYSETLDGGEELPPFEEFERALEAKRGGREMAGLMEARTREWKAQVLEQGREQGIAQGREQGREQGIAQGRAEGERALLLRLAERRFGAETAARFSELLAEVDGAEDLIEVGDWIVECGTGAELLERLRRARGT